MRILVALITLGTFTIASSQSTFASQNTGTIKQVSIYHGATADQLFEIYADAAKHTAATHSASGEVKFVDGAGESHTRAAVGRELHGFFRADGRPGLVGKIIEIRQGERIVMEWINDAWQLADDPAQVSDVPSVAVLEFKNNTVGAEIVLTQFGVPSYAATMTTSPFNSDGERGPLHQIIRVHWEMAYWQPIRNYLQAQALLERKSLQ